MMKVAEQPTIALIISRSDGIPILTETLTSSDEILELELALKKQDPKPLERVIEFRSKKKDEDEEFADFVEGVLSQPFVKSEVQTHAIQWFKSRAKIEAYQKAEQEASRVIAEYAFQVFLEDHSRTDFFLSGPKAKVRIRVIEIGMNQRSFAA